MTGSVWRTLIQVKPSLEQPLSLPKSKEERGCGSSRSPIRHGQNFMHQPFNDRIAFAGESCRTETGCRSYRETSPEMSDQMDVYQILIQDHRTIAKMFDEIAGTSNTEAERRKHLFSNLWTALEDHEITEENDFLSELVEASSFSPEAGKTAMIKELTADLFDDHSDFEAILQQISKLSTDSDEWLERVNELGALVREHARKEEDELFPPARRALDQTRAEEIGRQIQERG